jgi:hypothetical protein
VNPILWYPVHWDDGDDEYTKSAFFNDKETADGFLAFMRATSYRAMAGAPVTDLNYKTYSRWTA